MAAGKNLVGQKFGRLTVMELLPERTSYRARIYRCQCECGNYRDVVSQLLTAGSATECIACAKAHRKPWTPSGRPRKTPNGYARRQKNPDPQPGQVINEWTILGPCERGRRGDARWLCRCSCGGERKNTKSIIYQQKTCGHARRWEAIKGKRFGRLVMLHAIVRRDSYGGQMGLFRCDCGGVRVAKINSAKQGSLKSCGHCLGKARNAGKARCPACKKFFPITMDGTPTPQFCPDCAPKYAGRNWNVCPICGKLYAAPPSDKTVTCSKACSSAWRAKIKEGVPHKWSEDAKARLSERGQTPNLKLGTEAAKNSPIAGRFETNRGAKIWTLIDPEGQEYEVRNLMLWARENAVLFGKEPGDKSADQIAHGFIAIAQALRGVRKHPARSYFGWTLKEPPREPEEGN